MQLSAVPKFTVSRLLRRQGESKMREDSTSKIAHKIQVSQPAVFALRMRGTRARPMLRRPRFGLLTDAPRFFERRGGCRRGGRGSKNGFALPSFNFVRNLEDGLSCQWKRKSLACFFS